MTLMGVIKQYAKEKNEEYKKEKERRKKIREEINEAVEQATIEESKKQSIRVAKERIRIKADAELDKLKNNSQSNSTIAERLFKSLPVIFLFSFFLIIFCSTASAEITSKFILKQNANAFISETCSIDGYPCSSTYWCNITIINPQQNVLVSNAPMTNRGVYYNYTLQGAGNTSILGIYEYNVFCSNNINNGTAQDFFKVTPNGEENTTSQSLIYIAVIFVSLILFIICLLGAIIVPWRDAPNNEGIIVLSPYKYIKFLLWCFTYLIATWIFYIGWKISDSFLFSSLMGKFFYWFFIIAISCAVPLFIGGVWVVGIKFLYDLKLQKMFERGLPYR